MSKEPESYRVYPNIPQGFAVIAIMVVAMLLFSPILAVTEQPPWSDLLHVVYYILAMGGTLWFIRTIKEREEGKANFFFSHIPIAIFPLLIIAATGTQVIVNPVIDLIPIPDKIQESLAESVQKKDVFTLLLMVVVAPIIEELIFRGVILDGFLRQFTPPQAILASSFLFGFAHLNPWQFVSGLALGGVIGWVYYRTRSLIPCMVMHAGANLFGFAMRFYITPENVHQSTTVLLGGALNYFVIVSFALILTALCLWALQQNLAPAPNWEEMESTEEEVQK